MAQDMYRFAVAVVFQKLAFYYFTGLLRPFLGNDPNDNIMFLKQILAVIRQQFDSKNRAAFLLFNSLKR